MDEHEPPQETLPELDELEKVRDWRLHVILALRDDEGGCFSVWDAERLAGAHREVDLHALTDAIARGCLVPAALRIYL